MSDSHTPAGGAGPRTWPEPFGALAGKLPDISIDDIKAARREAPVGKDVQQRPLVADLQLVTADRRSRDALGTRAVW